MVAASPLVGETLLCSQSTPLPAPEGDWQGREGLTRKRRHTSTPCRASRSKSEVVVEVWLRLFNIGVGGGGWRRRGGDTKQRGNIWTHYHYQSRVPGPVSDGRCLIVADDSFRLVCHDCSASTLPALQNPHPPRGPPWALGVLLLLSLGGRRGSRQPALSTLVSICQPTGKARGCWTGLCAVFVFYFIFFVSPPPDAFACLVVWTQQMCK